MTWDQMLDIPIEEATTGQVLTDIECPECGRKIYLNTGIILTSYPAKYHYWCACGWSDCSHIRWHAGLSGEAEAFVNPDFPAIIVDEGSTIKYRSE